MATISQLPADVTLRKFRGDEFRVTFDFDIDLTGYTFSSDIYSISIVPTGSGTGTTTETTSVGTFTVVPVSLIQGQVAITLDETGSTAIDAGTYRWYLRWVSPLGDTRTVLNGAFEIVNDISQASGTNTDGVVIEVSVADAISSSGLPVAAGAAGLLNEIVWG
jgi:hypothetical protein